MSERIDMQARLIVVLAETMENNMWASDILYRCAQIEKAVTEIRRIAHSRENAER